MISSHITISSCIVETSLRNLVRLLAVISGQRITLSPSLAAWRTSPSQGKTMARRREGAATWPSWQWRTVSDSSKNYSDFGTIQPTPLTTKLFNDFISVEFSFSYGAIAVSVFGLFGS